jgi:hypothetical protein
MGNYPKYIGIKEGRAKFPRVEVLVRQDMTKARIIVLTFERQLQDLEETPAALALFDLLGS